MPFCSTVSPHLPVVVTTLAPQSPLQVSTHMGSSNGNRGRLDSRQMQKASPIVPTEVKAKDSTGCMVPINLRATQSGVPRRWASPPRATLSSIATLRKHQVEAEELVGL
jgi:hypothetical protein